MLSSPRCCLSFPPLPIDVRECARFWPAHQFVRNLEQLSFLASHHLLPFSRHGHRLGSSRRMKERSGVARSPTDEGASNSGHLRRGWPRAHGHQRADGGRPGRPLRPVHGAVRSPGVRCGHGVPSWSFVPGLCRGCGWENGIRWVGEAALASRPWTAEVDAPLVVAVRYRTAWRRGATLAIAAGRRARRPGFCAAAPRPRSVARPGGLRRRQVARRPAQPARRSPEWCRRSGRLGLWRARS